MRPTIGRIVHYRLTAENADEINRRRTTRNSIAIRVEEKIWPIGAQAHIGNQVDEDDIVAGIIVAVWGDECVNLQLQLDGCDSYWVTSANFVDVSNPTEAGRWDWPPRV